MNVSAGRGTSKNVTDSRHCVWMMYHKAQNPVTMSVVHVQKYRYKIFQMFPASTAEPRYLSCVQRNELTDRLEFYMTNYEQLRSKYEPTLSVNFDDWQLKRLSKLSQLQALNSELERLVSELEEGRRKDAESKRFSKHPVR